MVDATVLQRMVRDLPFYRSMLNIERSGEVVRYADVHDPWQEADAVKMDRAWLRSAGLIRGRVEPMRAFLERPRGASKTGDLGMMAAWALAFAPRRRKYILAAGDRDQARHPVTAMERLCELNPWLGATLEITKNIVRNPRTGSELEVIASDASTGWGHLVDGVLLDEYNNWPDTPAAQKCSNMLMSTLGKKTNCIGVVISNAGILDSWQWERRESIRKSGTWYFHCLQDHPSWFTDEMLNEQRILLPQNEYTRCFDNCWTSGRGNGLDPKSVEAACTLSGPQVMRRANYDVYVSALDLGYANDWTGFVVLALNFLRREIAVADVAFWNPADYGHELPLDLVEDEILFMHDRYQFDRVVFDPKETMGMKQRLANRGVPCSVLSLSKAAVQDEMAKNLTQSFNERIIKLYRHTELIRHLLTLEIVDRMAGLKLEAPRTASGHADLGFSCAMANFWAHCAFKDYVNVAPQEEVLVA
jgi:hypothetical protein